MAEKFTKASYKKHKREVGRTSRLQDKNKPYSNKIFFLCSPIPYGAYKGLTIKQIIDEHWPYWTAIEDKLAFASEVRMYVEECWKKIQKLKEPLRKRL